MKYSLGRYVYGITAIGFGICGLVWHDGPYHGTLGYIVAIINILGGAAVLWPRTLQTGALVLGCLYFVFALLDVPLIIRHPLVYNNFGNFFEPSFAMVSGAAILYSPKFAKLGYYAFGLCVVSFGLEQLFYLAPTASLVPKWIPPGQMFWAIATTAAFFLAAIALLTGYKALLAARLNAAMLGGFGLLVWVPALFADPHTLSNWTESLETLAMAACAWIVADYLAQRRSR